MNWFEKWLIRRVVNRAIYQESSIAHEKCAVQIFGIIRDEWRKAFYETIWHHGDRT